MGQAQPQFEAQREIFLAALQVSRDLRVKWVRSECDLRGVSADFILAMLIRAPGDFDQLKESDGAESSDQHDHELPTINENYRVLRKIGEGSFGVVYEAAQLVPVRRSVAIKVLRRDAATADTAARFRSERRMLAAMDHPAIARIYDAGTTAEGQLYTAMELVVDAEPITSYFARARPGLENLLRMFRRVCDGVQHAHLKGVIHRDLKPSNILVHAHESITLREDRSGPERRPVPATPTNYAPLSDADCLGSPKIIDFGVAKVLEDRLAEFTVDRTHGSLVGTLDYMSPEQFGVVAKDVDARTDVYSLGVVLYQLVAGATPFHFSLRSPAAFAEAARTLAEAEPRRPTETALRSGAGKDLAPILGLAPARRRELDWIVLRAIAKSRDRRYESASSLSTDIDRFLSNVPLEAGPPSRRYRVSKFLRRHRVGVATAATGVLMLCGGFAATAASLAEVRAAEARSRMQVGFFAGFFNNLSWSPGGKDVLLADTLPAASQSLERIPDPLTRGPLRLTLAQAYYRIGRRGDSLRQATIALEEAPRQAVSFLCHLHVHTGRHHLAVPLLQRVIPPLERREASMELVECFRILGEAYAGIGQYEDADLAFARALAAADRLPRLHLPARHRIDDQRAAMMASQGRFDESEAVLRGLLQQADLYAPNDLGWQSAFSHDLGSLLMRQGRLEEAEPLLRQSLASRQQIQFPFDAEVSSTRHNLLRIELLLRRRTPIEIADEWRQIVETQEGLQCADDLYLACFRAGYADALVACGQEADLEAAATQIEMAYATFMQLYPGGSRYVAKSAEVWASIYELQGREEAAAELREQVERWRADPGLAAGRGISGPDWDFAPR